jgi:hypothetical protein
MLGLSTLAAAVRHLAGNLTALSETVAEMNQNARQRLALDGPPEDPPALEHTPVADEPEAVSPSRKNGRRPAPA